MSRLMEASRVWCRPCVFVAATFLLSWSMWIAASSVGFFALKLRLPLLNFQVPFADLLILLGNVVPGGVALVMTLEEERFGSIINELLPTKTSRPYHYVFAILGPIVVNLLMLVVATHFDITILSGLRPGFLLRFAATNVLLAPLWEELGWRGYLLPIVERELGLGRAALLTGCVWGAWHFALYHWVGGVHVFSFLISFITIVGIGVILAILLSATNYSLITPILFHTFWNGATNWVLQVWPSYGLLAVLAQAAAAWIVALVAWRTMVSNGRMATV